MSTGLSITLAAVARAAGVSLATASRVLNNSDHPISTKTRARVLQSANAMGYRPNLLARSMRTDRTYTIGIIADDLLSPFTPPIIRGIQDYLKAIDYLGLIINSDWDPALEQAAINRLLSHAVEGIIFVESGHLAATQALVEAQKPYMFVHRLFGASIQNSVVPDDVQATRLVIDHLLGLGHRRIAHIAGPQGWHSAQRRLESYQATLAAGGIAVEPGWVAEGNWEYDGGAGAMRQLLQVKPPPTAIFVANDYMALGAIAAIQAAGLQVPHDIAIASYDNREFGRVHHPALTTVSLPAYEMGFRAAELLWQKIQGDLTDHPATHRADFDEVKICGQLYIRESCGADPAQQTHDELDVGTTVRHRLIGKAPERE